MSNQENIRAELVPVTEADFATVADLAATIWRSHYTKIIGMAQVEYMLAARYTPEALRNYVNSTQQWLELLRVNSEPVGYCSYSLTPNPDEMKLEQLYLLETFRKQGLGGIMLRHIESAARKRNMRMLVLQVNKRNADAIAVYRRVGFRVRTGRYLTSATATSWMTT